MPSHVGSLPKLSLYFFRPRKTVFVGNRVYFLFKLFFFISGGSTKEGTDGGSTILEQVLKIKEILLACLSKLSMSEYLNLFLSAVKKTSLKNVQCSQIFLIFAFN